LATNPKSAGVTVIGRSAAKRVIEHALTSLDPELIAVWGRRRVGKTFLIRNSRKPVEDHFFELTGRRNSTRSEQLGHFMDAFVKIFKPSYTLQAPKSWDKAFNYLADGIEAFPEDGKPITVFFDEAPWLDSRRSGFIHALEYFWNSKGSQYPRLKMFVCGSAASWIVRRIVKGRGGWHRRITGQIRVLPYKLREVEAYFATRDIRLCRTDVLKLYMVLGGIPYYLSLMLRGESIASFIDRLFFSESAELRGEFTELFESLFDNAPIHRKIVTEVARTKAGLPRSQIAVRSKLSSGGNLNRYIDNLEQSGFLEEYTPLGARGRRFWRHRVCDMFTLFHLHWLAGRTKTRSWQAITNSQAYKSWCGHAFEILAWNHSRSLADALGIAKSDYAVTQALLEGGQINAQIDLMFEVTGGAVYLFELKFCDEPYVMTAAEAGKLRQRRQALETYYKSRRSIIVCLLAPHGIRQNSHSKETVDVVLNADALFRTDGE